MEYARSGLLALGFGMQITYSVPPVRGVNEFSNMKRFKRARSILTHLYRAITIRCAFERTPIYYRLVFV